MSENLALLQAFSLKQKVEYGMDSESKNIKSAPAPSPQKSGCTSTSAQKADHAVSRGVQ